MGAGEGTHRERLTARIPVRRGAQEPLLRVREYPISTAFSGTVLRMAALTSLAPLRALETVLLEIPRDWAILSGVVMIVTSFRQICGSNSIKAHVITACKLLGPFFAPKPKGVRKVLK